MKKSHELSFNKALLIRLDRIGDLILTLPIDQMDCLAGKSVTWAISPGLSFLVERSVPQRHFITIEKKYSWSSFRQLLKHLKSENYDLTIAFHAPWWVALALWWARIPCRVGVKSQWFSFLFYNRGIRQKRSYALFHESEYNRRLVFSGLNLPSDSQPLHPLRLQAADVDLSKKLGLRFQEYYVVHPGMAGSARNWTIPLYIELIKRLLARNNVVLSFSASDHKWVDPIIENFGEHPKLQWMELREADDWLYLLSHARAVLAPSTGTVHVSASLGTPTVGIYSPVKVQSPKRWSPLGENVSVVWPDVECPGHFKCLMEDCPRFDCMRDISVEQVLGAILKAQREK